MTVDVLKYKRTHSKWLLALTSDYVVFGCH